MAKYGHDDMRNVLERASARETVGRVAGGAVCKRLLAELGVSVRGRVTSIGAVAEETRADLARPGSIDWEAVESVARRLRRRGGLATDVRGHRPGPCGRGVAGRGLRGLVLGTLPWSGRLRQHGGQARRQAPGRSRVHPRHQGGGDRVRAFANAAQPGSKVHDPFVLRSEGELSVGRKSKQQRRRAGGRHDHRDAPGPSGRHEAYPHAHHSACRRWTCTPWRPCSAHVERSDVTAVPAARVVGEAMVAYVVAAAYLEKFGGDSLADLAGLAVRLRGKIGKERAMAPLVALAGFMGSGKSSVGALAARLLGWRFVDLDAELVAREGMPIAEFFARHGETSFRQKEVEVLAGVLDAHGGRAAKEGLVLALGGGTLLSAGSRRHAGGAWPVSSFSMWTRTGHGNGRVGKAGLWPRIATRFGTLLARRRPGYERAADWILPVGRPWRGRSGA